MRLSTLIPALILAAATPAHAQPLTTVAAPASGGADEVDLLFLNETPQPAPLAAPPLVEVTLALGNGPQPVTLERLQAPAAATLAPGAFARVRYRIRTPAALPPNVLAALQTPSLRLAAAPSPPPELAATPPASAPAAADSAFLDALGTHEPVYAIFGTGTNTDGKLQLSFKYRLLGNGDPAADRRSGLHFAYTQTMFWDLGRDSLPFRNIDFKPELLYLLPLTTGGSGPRYAAQLGFRHESNGRAGAQSRDLNMLYLEPSAAFALGSYELVVAPRAWIYVGSLDDNPDLDDFRGNTGLTLALGEPGGLRLHATSRLSFETGRGALEADLSYPLTRLVWDRLNLYLYGGLFTGYGENLLDYDRQATRARIGVGIVR